MEELGVFDILGPIMVGPSSNHTGGACRIGKVARAISGGDPRSLVMGFYSVTLAKSYRGHATDRAIVAGLLGMDEDDLGIRDALKMALARNLSVSMEPIPPPVPDNNIMRCDVTDAHGNRCVITGFSVGGGSIKIADVDGYPLDLDGNGYVILIECDRMSWPQVRDKVGAALGSGLSVAVSERTGVIPGTHPAPTGRGVQAIMATVRCPAEPPETALDSISHTPGMVRLRYVPPVRRFFRRTGVEMEPITFAWMMADEPGMPLHERIIAREMSRDGKTYDEVVGEMSHVLGVMREAKEAGIKGDLRLLGGLDDGQGGRRMVEFQARTKPLAGATLVRSVGYALAVAEVNASMGRIVACPTGGAAGLLPGVLLGALEAGDLPDDAGVNALFVAAATGAAIGRLCSFSGSVGGCLGEIGFACAMGASLVAYLETQDSTAASHAAALALKSVMGLVCDPPAGPVEIPCIKRNGVLVGAAFAAGEMAAAGVRSAIPPDEVVLATKNVQDLMPQTIKGDMDSSLGCTPTAREMKSRWAKILAQEDSSIRS